MIEDDSAPQKVSFRTRKKKVGTLLKGLKYWNIVNKYVNRLLKRAENRGAENENTPGHEGKQENNKAYFPKK